MSAPRDDADAIADFEDRTGHVHDPNGPAIVACEYCDTPTQYADDHTCGGLRAEAADHARLEDDRDW